MDYDWLNDPISTIRIYENILHSGNVSVNGLVQEKAGEKSIFRRLEAFGLIPCLDAAGHGPASTAKGLRNSYGFFSHISWDYINFRDFLVAYFTGLGASIFAGFQLFSLFFVAGGKEFLLKMGLDTYQLNRISAWLTPFDFSDTIAYQQTQSMISIGSGGFFGKGFNQLELSVPVRESDMIFTVIAENFGFLGAASLLILYLILIYRMLRVTFASNNLLHLYLNRLYHDDTISYL